MDSFFKFVEGTPETREGFVHEVLEPGDGTHYPEEGNTVRIHYITKLAATGRMIDNSEERNLPFEFKLGAGQVVRGLEIGVAKMSRNEKARLTVPCTLGYGKQGYPPIVPPNSTLIFEVNLIMFIA